MESLGTTTAFPVDIEADEIVSHTDMDLSMLKAKGDRGLLINESIIR